jgi:hypothetical protein
LVDGMTRILNQPVRPTKLVHPPSLTLISCKQTLRICPAVKSRLHGRLR